MEYAHKKLHRPNSDNLSRLEAHGTGEINVFQVIASLELANADAQF